MLMFLGSERMVLRGGYKMEVPKKRKGEHRELSHFGLSMISLVLVNNWGRMPFLEL